MVTGIALLFAPSSFFESDQGQEYLETIGTQKVFVARIVILICLLFGSWVIHLLIKGLLKSAGVVD